jgi:hypothetical protein
MKAAGIDRVEERLRAEEVFGHLPGAKSQCEMNEALEAIHDQIWWSFDNSIIELLQNMLSVDKRHRIDINIVQSRLDEFLCKTEECTLLHCATMETIEDTQYDNDDDSEPTLVDRVKDDLQDQFKSQ